MGLAAGGIVLSHGTARRGSTGVWRPAAPRSLVRCLSPFVFSFVVLSFCNPETLRVSCQNPPLLLWTAAAARTLPSRACLHTAGTHGLPPPLLHFGISPHRLHNKCPCRGLGAVSDAARSSEEPWEGGGCFTQVPEMQRTVQGGSWQTRFTTTTIIIIIIILNFFL